MSAEAALLAAVVASPDDDLPRLVFADWCDEHGQPERAEFIRLQIENHRSGSRDGTSPAAHRIAELFHKHQAEWMADLPKVFRENARSWRFRRGFLEDLPITAAGFARLTKKVWARHPIQEVDLRDVRGRLAAVFARPEMNRVRELTFHASHHNEELTDDDLAALAATPNLTGLRRLAVWTRNGNALSDALAHCPSLHVLERLSLSDESIDADGVATLTRTGADNLRNLKHLRLEVGGDGPAVAEVIAAADPLAGLEELLFPGDNSRVGDRGVAALTASPHLSRLRWLSLHRQSIGPTGAVALGRSKHLTRLEGLHLEGNPIGADGLRAVANGPWAGLTALELDFCALDDAAAAALAEGGTPTGLTELVLHHNAIGPAGAVALSRAAWLGTVAKLDLEDNPIGDEGALALCRSTALAALTELRVGSRYRDYFSPPVVQTLKARFGTDVTH
jgi:uncharacterized protein (TIGR02996 family)